jgi:uncharacterized Zn finger protein
MEGENKDDLTNEITKDDKKEEIENNDDILNQTEDEPNNNEEEENKLDNKLTSSVHFSEIKNENEEKTILNNSTGSFKSILKKSNNSLNESSSNNINQQSTDTLAKK